MFARYVASQNERIGSNSTMSATSPARNPGAADVQHPKPIMDLIDLSRLSAHGIRPLPEPAGSALAAGLADATRPGDYYGMPRERSDAWYRLLRMLRLWAATGVGQPSRLRQRDALAQALARMAPLEVYWSFPGERALAELALHLEQDDHAAATVSNALGSVTMPDSPSFWAWHLEQQGELGGQRPPTSPVSQRLELKQHMGLNTTIGVVATDAALDLEALRRLAMMAHSGYAYAIRPIATPLDGDVVFAVSTGRRALPADPGALVRLGAIGADVVARSIMRGVYEASDLGSHISYGTRWPRDLAR